MRRAAPPAARSFADAEAIRDALFADERRPERAARGAGRLAQLPSSSESAAAQDGACFYRAHFRGGGGVCAAGRDRRPSSAPRACLILTRATAGVRRTYRHQRAQGRVLRRVARSLFRRRRSSAGALRARWKPTARWSPATQRTPMQSPEASGIAPASLPFERTEAGLRRRRAASGAGRAALCPQRRARDVQREFRRHASVHSGSGGRIQRPRRLRCAQRPGAARAAPPSPPTCPRLNWTPSCRRWTLWLR